jgi:hypothetical protein
MREYIGLCRQIGTVLRDPEALSPLLARWNARAGRAYRPSDFHYHGVIETEDFVGAMLLGAPALVPDLTYAELSEVLLAVVRAELSDAVADHFFEWLEVNLPGANVIELIFCTEQWLGAGAAGAELTPDQILAYAMAKSGRHFPDAPTNVPMPYPLPANT